eukprot:CAMPEP_0118903966 /NCGR_PEP_ID=MMETSP1166-20130328/8627_1 /TAXON_ID=1104430 /ORGANISM="Chrysoreinhardia sp, Strain CCMP3193" /LENGTH=101 /DNA_ID=CAMNT_0006843207 /DNA_START=32 /DNA_END=334 /DNA_ORIENTATION=+
MAARPQEVVSILGRTLELQDAFSALHFGRSYGAFHLWAEAAIEPVRSELVGLLYPVFAHTYLRMVAGEEESGAAFLERWAESHSSRYASQLEELRRPASDE